MAQIQTQAIGELFTVTRLVAPRTHCLVMAALWNRQAIISLSCGFFLSLDLFPRLLSVVVDWMSITVSHVM